MHWYQSLLTADMSKLGYLIYFWYPNYFIKKKACYKAILNQSVHFLHGTEERHHRQCCCVHLIKFWWSGNASWTNSFLDVVGLWGHDCPVHLLLLIGRAYYHPSHLLIYSGFLWQGWFRHCKPGLMLHFERRDLFTYLQVCFYFTSSVPWLTLHLIL